MLASSPPTSAQGNAPSTTLLKGSNAGQTTMAHVASSSSSSEFKVNAELAATMHSLANSFEHWRLQKQNQIIEEKQQYASQLAQHAASVTHLKSQHAALSQSKSHMLASLEKEKQELEELTTSIHDLEASKSKMLTHQSELEKNHLVHQQKERLKQAQLTKELPELELYQRALALEVAAVRKDLMKFVYTNIDHDDWSREFIIVIDVSSTDYRVTRCEPLISYEALTDDLNTHRDFYAFLKLVRQEFVKLVRQEKSRQ